MQLPLSLSDVSLWLAVTAIILLITSELLCSYTEQLGDFVIEKGRLRTVALVLGGAFMVTVLLRVVAPI